MGGWGGEGGARGLREMRGERDAVGGQDGRRESGGKARGRLRAVARCNTSLV